MSNEKAPRPLSNGEKDLLSTYRWAINHHLQLAEQFNIKLNELLSETTETEITQENEQS
jgi:hypothetical protein